MTAVVASPQQEPAPQLTEREQAVAALLIRGLTYKRVAKELEIRDGRQVSEHTVRVHVGNIAWKLGVTENAKAGVMAEIARRGLNFDSADAGIVVQNTGGAQAQTDLKTAADLQGPTIAVLPFFNASGDPGHDHLVDGITEDVITSLARNKRLFLIAAPTIFAYRASAVEPSRIGRELGVRYVVSGSVRRTSYRVRLTVHLIDVELDKEVWGERFDESMSDIFELQDGLSEQICAQVGLSIPLAETERAKRKRPHSLGAWDHYLLATHALRALTYEGYSEAERHLENCIALDPRFALAHARLAIARVRAAHYGWSGAGGTETIAQAQASASTALALDPDCALALDALASVCLYRGEHDSAAAFAQRAIEIDPSMTAAYGTMVNALAFAGRSDDALDALERCFRVCPLDPDRSGLLMGRVNALFVARQFSECVAGARAVLANRPNWYGGYVALAVAFAHLGKQTQAAEAAAQLLTRVPRFTLKRARQRPYFGRSEDIELLIEGLRIAGVPEG